MLAIDGETLKVTFNKWDQESYQVFLQSKKLPEQKIDYDPDADSYTITAPARFAHIFGLDRQTTDRGWLPLSTHLRDFQAFTAEIALKAKRYACWWTTGLGKTHLKWELARQIVHRTGGKVLLIVPFNIISQTLEIGREWFGLEARPIKSREHLRAWCKSGPAEIGIVNPEKFVPPRDENQSIAEVKHCAGVLLDEASILAAGSGVIKWALIHSCKGVEYKYTFTATPARNHAMEYASQGSFLEKLRDENEIIWTFFTRGKDGEWNVKKHAEAAFYRFLSGWSMYLVDPAHYGFDDFLKDLPLPELIEHKLPLTDEQREMVMQRPDPTGQLSLFGNRAKLTLVDRSKYGQIARGFIYGEGSKVERYVNSAKPSYVCDLVGQDAAEGLQPLVWTIFDEESRILEAKLASTGLRIGVLHGDIPKSRRPAIIETYRKGKLDVLISKASLLGFGLNFQNCGSMIFSGFDDSFERQFQAVRRAYRFGQNRSVRIHVPYIPELEGVVWENVQAKQARYERDTKIMESNYLDAMKGELRAYLN